MKHLILAACLCVLAGCGGGASGTTVTGKATFTDGTPLPRGAVTFTGKTGTYSSAIGPEGAYTMENVPDGSYQVVVTGVTEGDVQAADQHTAQPPGESAEITVPEVKSLIPEKYSDPDQSGLTVTVPGDYTIQVEKL